MKELSDKENVLSIILTVLIAMNVWKLKEENFPGLNNGEY